MSLDFPLYVFVDTNVVQKTGFNFNGGALLNLKKYHDAGVISVVTNQIVVDEVVTNIQEQVKEAAAQIKNFIKEKYCLNELRNSEKHKGIFVDFRNENWESYVIDQWKNYLQQIHCEILQNTDVKIESLLDDYFAGRAPFESRKEKKHEFPDAIIIKTLLKYSEQNSLAKIIVATEDQGWGKALKQRDNIYIVKQIKDVLSFISKEHKPENIERILKCIADTDNQQRIIEYIERYLSDMNIDFNIEECNQLDDFEIQSIKIAMESIDLIEGDEAFVTIYASVKVMIVYSFIDYQSSVYDKEDGVYLFYNEIEMKEIHEGRLSITVNMKLDESQKQYFIKRVESAGNMELDEDTCIDSERLDSLPEDEPDEWLGAKYFTTCPDCGCNIGSENDGGNGFCSSCASNH